MPRQISRKDAKKNAINAMAAPLTAKNIVVGLHSVQVLLNSSPKRVERLLLLQGRNDQRLQKLQLAATRHTIPVSTANRNELDKMAPNHQGAIAITVSASDVSRESRESLVRF